LALYSPASAPHCHLSKGAKKEFKKSTKERKRIEKGVRRSERGVKKVYKTSEKGLKKFTFFLQSSGAGHSPG
jgi:hypothetical protein